MSVIKVPLMMMAYDMAERGELDMGTRVRIREEDLRLTTGELLLFDLGLEPTIRDLITWMIIHSDNTATDLVLDRVGGVEALNEWIADEGFDATYMEMSTEDFFFVHVGCMIPDLASVSTTELLAMTIGPRTAVDGRYDDYAERAAEVLAVATDPEVAGPCLLSIATDRDKWLGGTTPRQIGTLLERLHTRAMDSPTAAAMMRTLGLQKLGTARLPARIPYPVAHKTGDASPQIANDAGIISAPSGDIVIAVLTAENEGTFDELEAMVARIAEVVVAHFEGG
jgi:beta-lactamase class A